MLLVAMTVFDKLSIVIPIGPDDNVWQHLLRELTVFGKDVEIILSACQTQPKIFDWPDNVIWIYSPQGRARQLNAGVMQSSRSILWFLHADTRLTENVIEAIQSYIEADELRMGYFKLKFANDGPERTQLNAWAANIRSRYFGLPFGDQGFIIHKSLLEQLNGFDEAVSRGEDLDLVVRVKARGISLQELPAELMTSARRYQQHGWFATTIRHVYLTWWLTRQAKRRMVLS